MKYLAYNVDGSFNGWYDDQIHKVIPTPNIQISDSDYTSHYSTMISGKILSVIDDQVVFSDPPLHIPTWDEIRNERNILLSQSDYTQLADAALTSDQQIAWKAYREALRKLPETFSSPDKIVWPTKPV